MNLEQQLRQYGEQVEAGAISAGETSEQPAAIEHDLDPTPITTRPSGRARVLVLCAAVLVLVVGIAAVVLRPDAGTVDVVGPGPSAPATDAAPPPPAEPEAPYSLWLSATRVPPGAEIVAVLVNHDDRNAMFGVGALVERWDGQVWVPHRQVGLCRDHCTATLDPLDEQLAIPDIGISATVEQPGPVERFTTDGLEVGWYRLSQEANEGVIAAATFEVAADAAAPAPLWPIDQNAISVAPPIVSPSGGSVRLTPLVPATTTAADIEVAVAGLSETAAVERWDGGSWVEVTKVALEVLPVSVSPSYRTATLPPLEPGAYQLVRTGPLGRQVGSFWVVEPSGATDIDMTEPTSDPPQAFPAPETNGWPAGSSEAAAISGVLTISTDGCSTIGGIRAAWPPGTVIEEWGRQVRLTDGRVYVAGTELELGGGHHRSDELAEPERCPGDEVLFIG